MASSYNSHFFTSIIAVFNNFYNVIFVTWIKYFFRLIRKLPEQFFQFFFFFESIFNSPHMFYKDLLFFPFFTIKIEVLINFYIFFFVTWIKYFFRLIRKLPDQFLHCLLFIESIVNPPDMFYKN